MKGTLKKLGQARRTNRNRCVRFNLKTREPRPGYRDGRVRHKSMRHRSTNSLMKRRRNASRNAVRARHICKTAKAAKLAKGAQYLAAGAGVGAAVGLAAGATGLDPVELSPR